MDDKLFMNGNFLIAFCEQELLALLIQEFLYKFFSTQILGMELGFYLFWILSNIDVVQIIIVIRVKSSKHKQT